MRFYEFKMKQTKTACVLTSLPVIAQAAVFV